MHLPSRLYHQAALGEPDRNPTLRLIDRWGHTITAGPAHTLSSCGTSPTVTRGNDNNGEIRIGTGAVSSCLVTFANAWGSDPQCVVNLKLAAATATVAIATTTPTTMTVLGSASNLDGSSVQYHCIGS
jgi:hypothetical protein